MKAAVIAAVEAGYKHIDCAAICACARARVCAARAQGVRAAAAGALCAAAAAARPRRELCALRSSAARCCCIRACALRSRTSRCADGNEAEIGEGIAECLQRGLCKREELFVTSKLWINKAHPESVAGALDKTLADLQLAYLDLVRWRRGNGAGQRRVDGRGWCGCYAVSSSPCSV